jgi:hypothetical protein
MTYACSFCGEEFDWAAYREHREEAHKVPSLLAALSAKELFDLADIRSGHPDDEGKKFLRSEMIGEFERRGKAVFDEMGWNTKPEAIYKNRYTGGEKPIEEEGFTLFLAEAWRPKELWTNERQFKEYKKAQEQKVLMDYEDI